MRALHRRALLLMTFLLALAATACVSYPLAPPQTLAATVPRVDTTAVAYVIGCEPDPPRDPFVTCEEMVSRLSQRLREAGIFAAVIEGAAPADPSAVVITVHPFPYRPDSARPGNSLVAALLSIAVPIWWSEGLGFRFALAFPGKAEPIEIDTTWSGTSVMWSLSSPLNIAPSRTFEPTDLQDVKRIREVLGLEPEPPF